MNQKPNVIYILADDMGYGDFSAFNSEGPVTPALDRLVREGTVLSNCYSASPVCAPARASILTGRYPQRCGVIDTLEARGLDRLNTSETTMADLFKANGYNTALIGKWHLGAIDPQYHPNNRGFEEFFGFRGGWNDYYQYNVEHNGVPVAPDGRYLTDVFSQKAVEYIEAHADHPFFLHLTYNAPHFPLQVPDEVVEKYLKTGKFTTAVCKIYAMIEVMDRGIGEILDALDKTGIAENTILVFASDNGPDMGGTDDDCQKRYNCELRGEKMLVYEGGIKVPAVIRWPGKIRQNTICAEVVHGTDWMPTLLSMCDIEIPEKLKIDGLNVSEALSGQKMAPRTLYWQWNRYVPEQKCNAAMRCGDMKLVHAPVDAYLDLPDWEVEMDVEIKYHPERYPKISDRAMPELPILNQPNAMLFDLSNDPLERRNLADQKPETLKSMEIAFGNWFEEVEKERLS